MCPQVTGPLPPLFKQPDPSEEVEELKAVSYDDVMAKRDETLVQVGKHYVSNAGRAAFPS